MSRTLKLYKIFCAHTSLSLTVGNLLGTAGELIFGRWHVANIILDVLFVVMPGHVVQFLVNSAGKYERR